MQDYYEKIPRLHKLPTDGNAIPVGDSWPLLEELKEWVGGYVEHVLVRIGDVEAHMFVNEDGRRLGLPFNVLATTLYSGSFDPIKVRDAVRADPNVLGGLTIVGNAWLWIGELPEDA